MKGTEQPHKNIKLIMHFLLILLSYLPRYRQFYSLVPFVFTFTSTASSCSLLADLVRRTDARTGDVASTFNERREVRLVTVTPRAGGLRQGSQYTVVHWRSVVQGETCLSVCWSIMV